MSKVYITVWPSPAGWLGGYDMATFDIDNELDKIYEQFSKKILHFWCTIQNSNNLNDAKDIAKAIVFCQ